MRPDQTAQAAASQTQDLQHAALHYSQWHIQEWIKASTHIVQTYHTKTLGQN